MPGFAESVCWRDYFRLRYFRRIALINLGAATMATLLLVWFNGGGWRLILRYALFSLVYASSIGTLGSLVMPMAGDRTRGRSLPVKLLAVSAVMLVVTVAGCFVACAILLLLGQVPRAGFFHEFSTAVRFCAIIALTVGIGVFFYESLRSQLEITRLQLRERELAEERSRKLAAEARLSSLESRVHPHFLFNTLNSISALIPDDPKRAEAMVGKLAALLHFSLTAAPTRLVSLGQEMKLVSDYLEIERARYEDRLRYSLHVPRDLEAWQVPPFALQSLVENSIKHVVAPRPEGGEIRVSARAVEGRLELEVSDTGPGFRLESIPAGHGLDNLLSRLSALFGDTARLEALTSGARAVVRISLPHAVRQI